MATSPIYSWPEPDNTDLVKNGALAIRTLGNAIDTTMGTMVAKTIIDAKGDLIAGSAADTALRLAVGANGETLVADSSTATGLRYNTAPVQINPILNSCMDIWQRGLTFTAAGLLYCADRWTYWRDAYASGITASRQTTNDTTLLPFVQYCLRIQRDSGTTGTGLLYTNQPLENVNSTPYIGQAVTISAYVRKGADFSSTSGNVVFLLRSGTGTDQAVNSMTGATTVATTNCAVTTSWVRYSVTGTVGTTAKQLGIELNYTPNGTAGAADYFEVTGVQIDIGSIAQPLRRNGATIQGELAACQRYYQRFNDAGGSATGYANGIAQSTTSAYFILNLLTTMRIKPTTLDISSVRAADYNTAFAASGSFSIYSGGTSPEKVTLIASTFTGLTQYRAYVLESNGTTAAFIGIGAEL